MTYHAWDESSDQLNLFGHEKLHIWKSFVNPFPLRVLLYLSLVRNRVRKEECPSPRHWSDTVFACCSETLTLAASTLHRAAEAGALQMYSHKVPWLLS